MRTIAPEKQARGGTTASGPVRSRSVFALRNWRVRFRLLAVVLVPVTAAAVLGGLRVVSSWGTATSYGQVQELTELGQQITGLTHELQTERDLVAGYIADGRKGSVDAIVTQHDDVDRAADAVRAQADKIDDSRDAVLRDKLAAAENRLSNLPAIRQASMSTQLPMVDAIDAYSVVVSDLLAVNVEIAASSGDSELAERVRALDALSRAKEQTSRQRALVFGALRNKQFLPGEYQTLQLTDAKQQSALSDFSSSATAKERQLYEDVVTGSGVDRAARLLAQVLARTGEARDATLEVDPQDWFDAMSAKLNLMRDVEEKLVNEILDRSRELRGAATQDALVDAGVVLLVIAFALAVALVVARSMTRPLQTLRASALEVAGRRLPETVREMRESDGRDIDIRVEPTGVNSADEIGQVARAFEEVHTEAVRLAGEQAALRANVNAMFVNLSRRSQSLVQRQLHLIDDLEGAEEDPDQLASLFKLDHLATRMRRHGENLLVLAGEDPGRQWGKPVSLVDVLRAAISEVEQYERVELRGQQDVAVTGRAVNDLVHLLAELLENATSYSSHGTTVLLASQVLADGRVMLEVADSGIGMAPHELAAANERLATPPLLDVSVSRRMGLFVVGRLASRHGIRVQMRESSTGGVSALVMLPAELVARAPIGVTSPEAAESAAAPAVEPAQDPPTVPEQQSPPPLSGPLPAVSGSLPLAPGEAAAAGGVRDSGPWTREPRTAERAADSSSPRDMQDQRETLPIFDAVESEWFRRRGRQGAPSGDTRPRERERGEPERADSGEGSWRSPGDEVWQVAEEAARTPVSAGVTAAGLPKRVPRGNLVPGSAGRHAGRPQAGPALRAPEAVRSRLSSYYQGVQRGQEAGRAAQSDEAERLPVPTHHEQENV